MAFAELVTRVLCRYLPMLRRHLQGSHVLGLSGRNTGQVSSGRPVGSLRSLGPALRCGICKLVQAEHVGHLQQWDRGDLRGNRKLLLVDSWLTLGGLGSWVVAHSAEIIVLSGVGFRGEFQTLEVTIFLFGNAGSEEGMAFIKHFSGFCNPALQLDLVLHDCLGCGWKKVLFVAWRRFLKGPVLSLLSIGEMGSS